MGQRSVRGVLVAAACAILLLSACSGGEASDPPSATQSTPPPAAGEVIGTGRAPNTPFTVTARDLGIHSYTTQPEVPPKSIRMTCSPNWSAANPSRGEYDWTQFDFMVDRAERWGFTDILYSFCATPKWAGKPVTGEDLGAFGPGTAQPVKDMADWAAFVTAVAQRYKGRITGYEVWNEASSPQFYVGTPAEMARMTEVAYEAIKKVDPEAYVLSASAQTHDPKLYDPFFPDYLKGLAEADWPVDIISAHFYPAADGTPQTRLEQVALAQRELQSQGAPAELPLWDTEVNYNVGVPGGEPDGRITGDRAAAWTVQTYLDGWRSGIRRSYWYLWTAEYYGFPGIQMRVGDPATEALSTFGSWVLGASFQGCEESDEAVSCAFTRGDTPFRIAYSTSGNAQVSLGGEQQVCPVYAGSCSGRSGTITVNEMPVYIGATAP